MTTKEYLGQIKALERKVRIKKSEIERLRELSYSPSIKMDGERVQTSGNYDPMANTVAKIIEEEERLSKLMDKYLEIREYISSKIKRMETPLYSDILYEKYVVGCTFDAMRGVIFYSRRNIIRYHGRALLEFERLYGDSYCNYLTALTEEADEIEII